MRKDLSIRKVQAYTSSTFTYILVGPVSGGISVEIYAMVREAVNVGVSAVGESRSDNRRSDKRHSA